MIALETLASSIEAGLNGNVENLHFTIFADMGEYKGAERRYNEVTRYINGVLTAVSSDVQTTQGLEIAIQTVQLRLLVSVDEDENDLPPDISPDHDEYDKYLQEVIKAKIAVVRHVVEGYLQTNAVQNMQEDGGKIYNVAMRGALLNTDAAEIRGMAGLSIELHAFLDYSFLQNGLNSNDIIISLDGERLPYIAATLTRSPVMELNAYSNSAGNAKGITTTKSFGVDLTMPAVDAQNGQNTASVAVLGFILDGTLKTYNLTVSVGNMTRSYVVRLGQTQISLEEIKNAAYSISFVEAAELVEEE